MSFDIVNGRTNKKYGLNPFGTGQRLSTIFTLAEEEPLKVSIPLEQGSVFRHNELWKAWAEENVSIPLEQGSVFRQSCHHLANSSIGLNPFGTGQCLSTVAISPF